MKTIIRGRQAEAGECRPLSPSCRAEVHLWRTNGERARTLPLGDGYQSVTHSNR